MTELEQKIELSLRQSDVNSKSKKKARQLRKRTATNKEEFDSVKKKRKTVAVVTEEESNEEEEMVYSPSESPESSEEEDDDITIQPQHPRLATRVGFNWETSDSVAVNCDNSDSRDESEPLDENTEVHKHTCIHTNTCIHRHTICALNGESYQYTRCLLKREQRDKSELISWLKRKAYFR